MPKKTATAVSVPTLAFEPIRTAPVVIPALDWSPFLCDGAQVEKTKADKAIAALGGEWRYPTLAELESNKDVTRSNPACDPARLAFKPGPCWTDQKYAPARDYFWVVYFFCGDSYGQRRGNGAFVRAVRSLPPGQ